MNDQNLVTYSLRPLIELPEHATQMRLKYLGKRGSSAQEAHPTLLLDELMCIQCVKRNFFENTTCRWEPRRGSSDPLSDDIKQRVTALPLFLRYAKEARDDEIVGSAVG